jgi:aspartyl-tRNA(Asn)/glutamyl-tRNA(Gln) amidotransferase subunit A
MKIDTHNLTLSLASQKIKKQQLTATELCSACLSVYKQNKALNAFTVVDEDYVLAQAEAIDKKIKEGKKVGALAGIPIGVKDNMSTEHYFTSCASASLSNNTIPKTDATVVSKLRGEDAVIFGKTNMDEFAMGFSSTNTVYGEVSNPYNNAYSAGGSSGGSAVSVATSTVLGALGSDTGGSIRQPAANCGVFGLKPTFNSVSRSGMFPLSKTLDHVGCMTKTVKDCALLFSVIKKLPKNYSSCFKPHAPKLKVAYLADFSNAFIDKDVSDNYLNAINIIKDIGYKAEEIKFDLSAEIAHTYTVLCSTEAVESFSVFNAIHPNAIQLSKCGNEVNKRIAFGKSVLAEKDFTSINHAYLIRERVREQIADILDKYDIILSPTTLLCALKKHEEVSNEKGFTSDLFSIVCNLTGIPALNVPMGFDGNNIPVGLMIMAAHDREEDIFTLAADFEKAFRYINKNKAEKVNIK